MRRKIWLYKLACIQCRRCCKNIVCDLGVILLRTTETPCPALIARDKLYWCGLITDTSKYLFPELGLTDAQYDTLRQHILAINNFGEGCDLERWHVGTNEDIPLISLPKARKAVPICDCSGRKLSKSEKEDIARYIVLGAEMQGDKLFWREGQE